MAVNIAEAKRADREGDAHHWRLMHSDVVAALELLEAVDRAPRKRLTDHLSDVSLAALVIEAVHVHAVLLDGDEGRKGDDAPTATLFAILEKRVRLPQHCKPATASTI